MNNEICFILQMEALHVHLTSVFWLFGMHLFQKKWENGYCHFKYNILLDQLLKMKWSIPGNCLNSPKTCARESRAFIPL